MSDIEALQNGLESLLRGAAAISGKERALVQDGETDLRDAMRIEISQTQLLRRIIFRNEHDAKVAFEVMSGRVLKLTKPTSPSLFQDTARAQDTFGNPRPKLEESDTSAVCAVVARFLAGAQELWVESQRLDRPPAPTHVGISLEALFQPPAPLAHERLMTFMAEAQEHASAGLVVVENSCLLEHGPKRFLSILQRLAVVEATRRSLNQENTSCCMVYSGHPAQGASVLCAAEADGMALMACDSEALGRVLKLWNANLVGE